MIIFILLFQRNKPLFLRLDVARIMLLYDIVNTDQLNIPIKQQVMIVFVKTVLPRIKSNIFFPPRYFKHFHNFNDKYMRNNTVQRRLFFRSELCTDVSLPGPSRNNLRIGILSAMTHLFPFCLVKSLCSVWIVPQLYKMKIHLKRGIRS